MVAQNKDRPQQPQEQAERLSRVAGCSKYQRHGKDCSAGDGAAEESGYVSNPLRKRDANES